MNDVILELQGIRKSFGSVKVLESVDFSLKKGEVHCLVGENGAGKSTLCKIIAGALTPDGGQIYYKDNPITLSTVLEAQTLGIGLIHQELMLVPKLTVLENMFLGMEVTTTPFACMNWKTMRKKTIEVLAKLEVDIDPDTEVSKLSTAQQQMVEIAKAMLHEYQVLIFDEPTASISKKNTEVLFRIIHQLRESGVAMIYISHRLEEFTHIADRVTILRDGQRTGTLNYKETSPEEIIRLMVGRELTEGIQRPPILDQSEAVLKIENFQSAVIKNISLTAYKGEILGFAGLVGAGRTELLRLIFGADPLETGQLFLRGKPVTFNHPKDAVANGIGFLTEDRKLQGLILGQSIRVNTTLSILKRFIQTGRIHLDQEIQFVQDYINQLKIVTSGTEQIAGNLSGGNQQKVVLARWLATQANILLFDEPTRGIDVGAKSEIYALMNAMANEGATILMVSSDLPELLRLSDRIIVMRAGQKIDTFLRKDATEEKLMHAMVGIEPSHISGETQYA